MALITNYQKQKLKMHFGKDTNLDMTFEQAEELIKAKETEIENSKKLFGPNNLESSGHFDRWIEDLKDFPDESKKK